MFTIVFAVSNNKFNKTLNVRTATIALAFTKTAKAQWNVFFNSNVQGIPQRSGNNETCTSYWEMEEGKNLNFFPFNEKHSRFNYFHWNEKKLTKYVRIN